MKRCQRLPVFFLALACLLGGPLTVQAAPPDSQPGATSAAEDGASAKDDQTSSKADWQVSAKGGVSFFTQSRSNALPHRLKPNLRLSALTSVHKELRLGVELVGVLSESTGYRLLGGTVAGRTHCYNGEVFDLDLLFGVGLGTAPKILSPNLDTESKLAVWANMGLGLHWALPGDIVSLGMEFLSEQITVVTATAVLTIHL